MRVLGDWRDVPGRWATIAESVSALVYGPGRVLLGGVDEETARRAAAGLSGPWANLEVVEGASRPIDEATRVPGAPGTPVPPELRRLGRKLVAASEEQRRHRDEGRPVRHQSGWPTLVVMAVFLGITTVGLVAERGAGAWSMLLFWTVWAFAVRRRLHARAADGPTVTDVVRAAGPTMRWLAREPAGSEPVDPPSSGPTGDPQPDDRRTP